MFLVYRCIRISVYSYYMCFAAQLMFISQATKLNFYSSILQSTHNKKKKKAVKLFLMVRAFGLVLKEEINTNAVTQTVLSF